MDKWQCRRCEYVYDVQEGDPENDIEPGTPFEELPKKWSCPECGAKKNDFKPYEEEEWETEEEEYKEDEE